MSQLPLQGRIAIVTGASRRVGIGTAICRLLAQRGADVYFTYYRPYDATMEWGADTEWPVQLLAELRGLGVRAASAEANLSLPNTPGELLTQVGEELGEPSVLVNNATHSTNDGYKKLDAAALDAHYAVNIRGTCLLTVEFARRFAHPEGARIINLVSGQDKGPQLDELAYVATKGAISAFTRSLALELAPRRITVNAVDPGPTDTGWMPPELKQQLREIAPMGRLGMPEDAARLIAFLASDDAAFITGQIIHSDGGFC